MHWFKRSLIRIAGMLFPTKIIGKENIPESGALLVCNHFSAVDCLYFLSLEREDLYILAKKEVFKNKTIGKILKIYGAIPIDRENPDMRSLMESIKVLKKGGKLTIFPEGTRNKTGTDELQEIKGGAAVFAVKAKCPIVPIMIRKKPKFLIRNNMIIGKPFFLEQYYSSKLDDGVVKEMDDIIACKMKEQQEVLRNLTAKKGRNS